MVLLKFKSSPVSKSLNFFSDFQIRNCHINDVHIEQLGTQKLNCALITKKAMLYITKGNFMQTKAVCPISQRENTFNKVLN